MRHVDSACPLCQHDGGRLLWRDAVLRVIAADEADYPGLIRVVWQAHVPEWSDLTGAQRAHFSGILLRVEQTMRDHMQPDKINLASLGNVVPHLHWHVIPRFQDDPHFPQPIWAQKQRAWTSLRQQVVLERADAFEQALRLALNQGATEMQ